MAVTYSLLLALGGQISALNSVLHVLHIFYCGPYHTKQFIFIQKQRLASISKTMLAFDGTPPDVNESPGRVNGGDLGAATNGKMEGELQSPQVVDIEAADMVDRVSQQEHLCADNNLNYAMRHGHQNLSEAEGARTTFHGKPRRGFDCDCDVISDEEQKYREPEAQAPHLSRDPQHSMLAGWAAPFTSARQSGRQSVVSGNKRLSHDKRLLVEEHSRQDSLGDIAMSTAGNGVTVAAAATGEEQRSLRQDIINLTYEDERETSSSKLTLTAGDRGRQRLQKHNNNNSIGLDVGADTNRDARYSDKRRLQQPSDMDAVGKCIPHPVQDEGDTDMFMCLKPSSHRSIMGSRADKIRHIKIAEQDVTAKSLADVVRQGMEAPRQCVPDEDDEGQIRSLDALFLSLTIRNCKLSSLLPVAGLLHDNVGICEIDIDGCAGLALTGLKRVLIEAPCLRTLAIRRCGLTRLPRLRSESIEELDISSNSIKNAAGLETLFRLKKLNMTRNYVHTLMDLRPLIPLGMGYLQDLSLEGNPVQDVPRYRSSVVAMIPSIQILDGLATPRPWSHVIEAWASTLKLNFPVAREHTVLAQDVEENGRYVRGLAGLGIIWAGNPPVRQSSSRSSSIAPSSLALRRMSPGGTPPCSSKSNIDLSRTNTISRASRSRPLMTPPRRCRQIEANTTRSQPKRDSNSRLRYLPEEQESLSRKCEKAWSARVSRSKQKVSMERLSQPLRLLRREGSYSSCSGCSDNLGLEASFRTDCSPFQVGSTTFAKDMFTDSVTLVDRPTAFKRADGRWEGVTLNKVVEMKSSAKKHGETEPLQDSVFQDEAITENTTVAPAPSAQNGDEQIARQNPSRTSETRKPEAISAGSLLVGETDVKQDEPSPFMQQTPWAEGATTYPRSPLDSGWHPMVPSPYPKASRTQSPSKQNVAPQSPDSSKVPAVRATITLPDSWGLNQPSTAGVKDNSTSGTRFNIESKHGSMSALAASTRRCAGRQKIERRSSLGDTKARMRRSARDFHVLKTPRDLADAILRVFEIKLDQEEARSLYHQVDADGDGALGAEDLLRGALVIARLRAADRKHLDMDDSLRQQGRQIAVDAKCSCARSMGKLEHKRNLEQTRMLSQQSPRRRGRDLDHRRSQKQGGPRRSHSHRARRGGVVSCSSLDREDDEYFQDEKEQRESEEGDGEEVGDSEEGSDGIFDGYDR